MPTWTLPYGRSEVILEIPGTWEVDVIQPRITEGAPDPRLALARALDAPLDGLGLSSFAGAQSAAIAVNDKTRPAPHTVILPPLLERLNRIGIPDERITLLVATGTHMPLTEDEIHAHLPADIVKRFRVESHDCDQTGNLIALGSTPRGTPVWVNRRFYEADLKIVTGDIEPHHFAGFSGGVKTAAIGLTARETINTNHRWLLDENATIGMYQGNPLRQDIEDIGAMIGVDFALNMILTPEHEVIHALAGAPKRVMEAGIPLVRRAAETPVRGLYDLVIASAGGHPKDINLYQAQKALTFAAMITQPGGTIILVAACSEGIGSVGYERFMDGIQSHSEVLDKFNRVGFQVGPHKALQIAREALRKRIIVVSDMPQVWTDRLLLESAPDVATALQRTLAKMPESARIAVMPHATTTLPHLTVE